MAVKHLKPTSAGRRWQTIADFSEITCTTPEKSLLEPLPVKAGRNNAGRITMRHQGGRVKRQYRVIDFKRNKDGVPAKVATIEYDPNRSARIALLHYVDGEKRYILAPKGSRSATPSFPVPAPTLSRAMPCRCPRFPWVPSSTQSSSSLARVPLSPVPLVPLASSWARRASTRSSACFLRDAPCPRDLPCSIGEVGNAEHSNIVIGKAGRHRKMGVRPTVRGTVMNPVDHPHGGGEGRSHTSGRPSVSPWGTPSKGYRTRNKKKTSNDLIIRRRKK